MREPKFIKKGDLVKVGDYVGVVTALDKAAAPRHAGVWYGELAVNGQPRIRTVPVRHLQVISDLEIYISN